MVMKKFLSALKTILIPVIVGLISGLLIRNNVGLYDVLIKPPFALGSSYFSIIWGILYVLMGISLYLFKTNAEGDTLRDGKLYFYIQLALNFSWSIIFFNLGLPFIAFLELLVLLVFVLITTIKFYQTNKLSGILLVPYTVFLVYAGYLNFALWFLNM